MSARGSFNAEREALAVDVLRHSGHLRLGVRGESMLPALWPGDVVEVVAHSLPSIRPGEVILISREGRLYVHRFVACSGADAFVARGDSMPHADPLYESSALLGRIEGVVRKGRAVSTPIAPRFRHRALGYLICRFSLARRLALKFHHWSNALSSDAPESAGV